jgi:hypothetical protein
MKRCRASEDLAGKRREQAQPSIAIADRGSKQIDAWHTVRGTRVRCQLGDSKQHG